jgi:hypothetical protein
VNATEFICLIYLAGIIYCMLDLFIVRAELADVIRLEQIKERMTDTEIASIATIAIFLYVALWPIFKTREFHKWIKSL